jgi:hypothetical protein
MHSKTPGKKTVKTANQPRRGRVTGSTTEQIDRLQPGESISVTQRFEVGNPAHGGDDIKAAAVTMRSTLGSYVQRVMADGDGLDMREYRTESGTFVTDDKTGIMLVVVLTRIS